MKWDSDQDSFSAQRTKCYGTYSRNYKTRVKIKSLSIWRVRTSSKKHLWNDNLILSSLILSIKFNLTVGLSFLKVNLRGIFLCGKRAQMKAISYSFSWWYCVFQFGNIRYCTFSLISNIHMFPFVDETCVPRTMILQHVISHKRLPHDLWTSFVMWWKLYIIKEYFYELFYRVNCEQFNSYARAAFHLLL